MIAQEMQNDEYRFAPTVIPSTSASSPPTAPPPRRSSRRGLTAFAAAVIGVSAAIGGGTAAIVAHAAQPSAAATTTSSTKTTATSAISGSAAAVYASDVQGVVTITTVARDASGALGQATGSGVVVDTKGDIVTNQHVIAGATQVQVSFSNGQTVPATLVGSDSTADLAVVKVNVAASSLHPLTFANSSGVQIGEQVYAIGAPFGLTESFTAGVVSGLNRSGSSPTGAASSGLIQTDAAINPGNSGGPLVNTKGQVIGLNNSIESPVDGNVGVGFAIPSNQVSQLLASLEGGLNV